MEKQKMTKEEKSWILYDVANSAFIMTLTATIPIYFRALATEAGISATHATSIWGTCTSIAILILALLSPILGALADYQNMKKRIFMIFLAIGIGGGGRWYRLYDRAELDHLPFVFHCLTDRLYRLQCFL